MKEKELFEKAVDKNLADKERIRIRAKSGASESTRYIPTWKKGLAITVVLVVVCIATLAGMLASFSPVSPPTNMLPQPINDYSEIFSVIESFNSVGEESFDVSNLFGSLGGMRITSAAPKADSAVMESDSSYNSDDVRTSETNVQTEGMDEGDLVKVRGQYIYKLSGNGCTIVRAVNGQLSELTRIGVDNYVPVEMYVSEDNTKLVMIGGIYEYNTSYSLRAEPMYDWCYYVPYYKTDIRVYDITDKSAPVLEREITLDGNYYTSRLEEETNRLYYVVNYYFYYGNEEKYIPSIMDSTVNDGVEQNMPSADLYYYSDIANYSYLIIGYIDLDEPSTDAKQAAYLGLDGTIYVSAENIFVATYDYYSGYEKNIFGWVRRDESYGLTRIVKISLDDLKQTALTRIKGTIKDRYSLDEYNDFLRVAVTVNTSTRYNAVYVLDNTLELTSKIENIAPGESIYAVRFNGITGSLVTFETVDPYYRLDLSDPYDIKISDGLKKPGVSFYIHYIEGTPYTLGIGRSTDENSGWVRWNGIEVVLYYNDPDDPLADPVIVAEYVIEGDCYADILYEPKALLYDKELGIFGFSYQRWSYSNYYYYYSSMEQGFALFSFDTSATDNEDKLTYRTTLTNLNLGKVDMSGNYNYYYDAYWSFISRGVFIGDYIYTISDRVIASYDIETLSLTQRLTLWDETN